MTVNELPARALCRRWDPAALGFQTTADLPDLTEMVGQPRAVAALDFGTGIRRDGYNIFAHGPPGTGRRTLVRESLRRRAATQPVPPDLCYLHNFDDPRRPRLVELPPGTGAALSRDVEHLIEDLRAAIAGALETEEYQQRRGAIESEVKQRPQKMLEEIGERAAAAGLAVVHTPTGLVVMAVRDGEALTDEKFEQLSPADQQQLKAQVEVFQAEIEKTLRQLPRWLRERRERLHGLRAQVIGQAVEHLMQEMEVKYAALPVILEHLRRVRQDVTEHAEDITEADGGLPEGLLEALPGVQSKRSALRRYRVNVLVDNAGLASAPVIEEDNPTYERLVGRIDHATQLGTLVTDFTLIKSGALHRANGGYLVLEAHKLLRAPFAWEALKRALQTRALRIEPLGQALSLIGTVSLEPEPARLDVQVALLGEPIVYYLLSALDPDFAELFKVSADFDDQVEADGAAGRRYAQLLATIARREQLRPLDAGGMARLLEQSARLAGHQEKLTARIGMLVDLLREADYWAGRSGGAVVTAAHVQQAIDAQIARADRVRERMQEEIARRTVMIDTEGERVGQVNGLSVSLLGTFAFARPTRITARVRLGKGDLVDIEREVELGGPVHSKGVLILAAYLGGRYVPDRVLALSASLVFEQSYATVEGDSASAAELFALLSAIAGVPLKQNLAVTGSVNQHGEIQTVGNVTEKIEGFYDVCRARGLTGEHGVIIPAANVQHLMLRHDVVENVAAGKFHVYPIRTADEGLTLLTGMIPGERDAAGCYPEGTFNRLVEDRLEALAEQLREFGAAGQDSGAVPVG